MVIDIYQQMQTGDGKTVRKGDKVWYVHQGPCIDHDDLACSEVTVGEPMPWSPSFVAEAKYCRSSEEDANDWIYCRGKYKLTEEQKEILREIFGTGR